MIPWRVKSFISRRFPLATHLWLNLGAGGNDPEAWDKVLAEEWDSPRRNWPTKNAMMERLLDPTDAILDVGCGTGSMLRYLKARGFKHLHGLEQSRYVIERLSAEGISATLGRLPRIDTEDQKFDVVIASQVLEHIIRRRTFLFEIHRVLKPGGTAHIFVPDDCLVPLDEPSHVAVYTAKSLRRVLSRQFKVEQITSFKDDNFEIPVLHAVVSRRDE